MELRSTYKDAFVKKHGVKFGFMSAFIRAAAAGLVDMPSVNAVIDQTEIVYRDYVDISVAVATPKVSALCRVNLTGECFYSRVLLCQYCVVLRKWITQTSSIIWQPWERRLVPLSWIDDTVSYFALLSGEVWFAGD